MPRVCSEHAWCPGHYLSTCPPTVESHATISACLHGITHTPYNFISWQWIVTGATHITHKTHFILKVCLGSGRPSISNPTCLWYLHVPTTCLNLQSHDTISCQTCCSLIFLKLPCVPVRGRKLKMWYKEHIHNKEYNWDE